MSEPKEKDEETPVEDKAEEGAPASSEEAPASQGEAGEGETASDEESMPSSPPAEAGEAPSEAATSPPEAAPEPTPESVWGASATGGAPDRPAADPGEDERRTAPRKGIRLNKLISATLNESPDSLYLHLVDISEGGMRVNGDLEFSQTEPFKLTLQMEAFGRELAEEHPHLAIECRVVWQKRLLGGMFVSGLQFVNLTPEIQGVIKKILERSSPEGRRLRFRLNRVLGVGIGLEDETRWLYPLALDLSVEGMRLRLDEDIEIGSKFPLQVFLEFDLPTVRVQAEAVWKEQIGTDRYQVGLRFFDVSEENAKAIQEYIDRCLAKETKL